MNAQYNFGIALVKMKDVLNGCLHIHTYVYSCVYVNMMYTNVDLKQKYVLFKI